MKRVFKLNLHVLTAFFIYAAVCAALYAIEYRLYAGAVKTALVYAIIFPPVLVLTRYINGAVSSIKDDIPRKRIDDILTLIVSVIAVLMLGWLLYTNIYNLVAYQLLGALLAQVILDMLKKHARGTGRFNHAADSVSAAYLMALIATALYLLIVQPSTVSKAEKALLDEGFSDVSFVMTIQDDISRSALERSLSVEIRDSGLNMYIFRGELDGADFGVFIDVAGGKVIHSEKLAENAVLRYLVSASD